MTKKCIFRNNCLAAEAVLVMHKKSTTTVKLILVETKNPFEFCYKMDLVALSCLQFHFVRVYCDSHNISMHSKKRTKIIFM